MNPITPEVRDGMPAAVAASLLAEPRARLTNLIRKTCKRAREKVFVSYAPIRRMPAVNDAGQIIKGWGYYECKPVEPQVKTRRRFSRATLAQLGKWLRRAVARRQIAQRQYLAVEGVTQLAERKRQAYEAIAAGLDIIRDACENEIARRKAQTDSILAFRNCSSWAGRTSSVSFYRKADLGPST